jgi:uncharacterized protein (TIGR02147 family)
MESSSQSSDPAAAYRAILQRSFDRRKQRNQRYSLRAMARDLTLSPSFLSDLFHGKAGVSVDSAARMAKAMGLNPDEQLEFCDLVEMAHGRNASMRTLAELRQKMRQLEHGLDSLRLETFRLISEWYHFAILEVLKLKSARHSVLWLSKRLNIEVEVVSKAIERLELLGFLVRKDSRWQVCTPRLQVGDELPSSVVRHYHGQMLEKSIEALNTQGMQDRESMSMTIAFAPEDLPKYRELAAEFRMKVTKLAGQNPNPSQLKALCVQFFRLDMDHSPQTADRTTQLQLS